MSVTVAPDRVFPILRESILVDGFHLVIDLERSHGSYMFGALSGVEYLDCYSYFASLPIGHNHPKMRDPEFLAALTRAALANPSNSDAYSSEFAAFVATFRELAMPEPFTRAFFIAGGALAVENAMKAAFDWKQRRNVAAGRDPGGDRILHFREAFHGRSGYTLSVTNTEPRKTEGFPKFDWPRVTNPKLRFPVDPERVAVAEAAAVGAIEAAFDRAGDRIAAILIEPIQGEGGDNHFRAEFLRELRRLADQREALLIFDEVQTGMGMTGRMWAFEALGVTPDLVAFGKKTQVCGVMTTDRIDQAKDNVFRLSSRINSTWGGNLADMVRCNRYLRIIDEEGLVANAAEVGGFLLAGLADLAGRSGGRLDNVRGRGLMIAADLASGGMRDRLRARCWETGLATLACGPRTLRLRPPLTFSRDDATRVLEILEAALAGL